MNSYLTQLECASCGETYSSDKARNLCPCGAPLLACYDLREVSRIVSRDDFSYRAHNLWRYKELLPVKQPENIVSCSEGFTPVVPSKWLGKQLGMDSLHFKDESFNPTGSFKARGLSVAVSKALELGIKEIALPTAGNAGGAAAAYAARAGIGCHVFMPEDTPALFEQECRMYGAEVRKVKGFITDANVAMQKELEEKGWFSVATFREPYRVEGKKTILFELAQHFSWDLPDVILFPTGGGTGIVAAWKACLELKELGWVKRFKMPRLIAVQVSTCAPIVRAFEQGSEKAAEWENPHTFASGMRVPKTIGDFLILRAIRESGGCAIAVTDDDIRANWNEIAEKEGIWTAPEGAAAVAALKLLVKQDKIKSGENTVVLLTGGGLKYAI